MHNVLLNETFRMMGHSISSNNVKLSKFGLSECTEKTRICVLVYEPNEASIGSSVWVHDKVDWLIA